MRKPSRVEFVLQGDDEKLVSKQPRTMTKYAADHLIWHLTGHCKCSLIVTVQNTETGETETVQLQLGEYDLDIMTDLVHAMRKVGA